MFFFFFQFFKNKKNATFFRVCLILVCHLREQAVVHSERFMRCLRGLRRLSGAARVHQQLLSRPMFRAMPKHPQPMPQLVEMWMHMRGGLRDLHPSPVAYRPATTPDLPIPLKHHQRTAHVENLGDRNRGHHRRRPCIALWRHCGILHDATSQQGQSKETRRASYLPNLVFSIFFFF